MASDFNICCGSFSTKRLQIWTSQVGPPFTGHVVLHENGENRLLAADDDTVMEWTGSTPQHIYDQVKAFMADHRMPLVGDLGECPNDEWGGPYGAMWKLR